jgi:amino acid adenylation domain-containing protein
MHESQAANKDLTPDSGLAPDAGAISAWLAVEVARAVGVSAAAIDPHRPLASLALDSLAAIELMHAIENRLGVILGMETLFSEMTLAELAATLQGAAGTAAPLAAGDADPATGADPSPLAGTGPGPGAASSPTADPAADAGDCKLSPAQLSLWFLHALEPASPAYNVPNAVRVRGELDAEALVDAFRVLVARHPALRTTFVAVDGEPLQRVAAAGEIELVMLDAAAWTADELTARLAAEGARAFDLERGPLVRLGLYRVAADEHVLLLCQHHIVTDFWSLGVMLDELGALYAARRQGGAPRLPPPPPSYAAWTRRQERELAGAAGEALWDYWRHRLAGDLPVFDLPGDRPRPRLLSTAGGAHRAPLAAPLAAAVRQRAREAGTTPFVVLLAAFEALLHRHSGQSELLLGTVTAARSRAEYARTLGYFVNPLVLRADLAGDPGFAALVARARADALGAFEHQDLPFPLLVERLQPHREPNRSPLFQVMFVLQKAQLADGQDLTGFALGEPGARVDLGGLRLETIPLEQRIAQFDLTLTMGEVGGRLIASFDYSRDLFDAATIERLAGHFERLLTAALDDPERAVSALPLLGPAEARQLIEGCNDTRVAYRDGASLAELFAEQAAATPAAAAVVFAGREMTYAELARRAGQLARRLRRLGVGPEVLVGVCVERSFDVLVAALGVLAAGGAYLPIDPEYPRERIAHLLDASGTRLVLAHDKLRPLLTGHGGAAGRDGAAGPRLLCLDTEWESIAADAGSPDAPFAAAADAAKTADADAPLAAAAGAANLACAIFTSGSTGLPKGVLLEHRNLVNMVASFARSYRPATGDRILPLTSIAYASFVGEVLPLLLTGGAVVLPQKHELLDVAALVSLIARHQVSMVSTVPSMLASLSALGDRLPHLRLLLVGGEALAAADVAGLLARPGAPRLVNGYGLTETSVCSTVHVVELAELAAGHQPPIGKPLMNQRVYVLDRHLEPQPIGCAGELYVAGDGLARGYLGQPGQTAARFLPDPFAAGRRMYRTGDLAAWRADGNLMYLGRNDQQVKVRGFRIELAEIEAALGRHPRVQAAAAVVRRDPGDPSDEPRLLGYVVPRADGEPPPSAGELLAWLRDTLPDYMVPAALVFLAALPRTPNGKLDAARLPLPERTRPELAAAYTAPRSELERAIAAVWREALKVDSVGLDDSFFDLGGHSLLMAKVHARLGEALGRPLALLELFQYPTVRSLARHLAGAGTAAAPSRPAAAQEREARPAPGTATGAGTDIAVVGMAGRFPGAADVRGLWRNLVEGREGISFFSAEELIAAGVDAATVERPDYVRAKGALGGVDLFDAGFFGLNPREVELMDPQHRLFLECAWEALDDAGWDADRFAGLIGVYGGESMNTYMVMNLLSHMELVASADTLQASLGNDKDPLTARVSYKLNLKGPSITIQSASSTSLVAVHSACVALGYRDCDMALAGGVSIHLPEKSGYLYQEGGTVARDGHTRAFDAGSTGFVSGNGCGVVVLKRLADALADGDHVYAVIKGTACNNDGAHKVSFMAPSVDGQVELYRLAYQNAGVDPATVSYVECHGTGTAMGDPIEIGALTRAFAAHTEQKGFCAIGSLKTNIGHLDTAAGVCGLIKASLALHHRTLPPSLHFQTPNPRIDFANSPFFVNTELRRWEVAGGGPRRAGVTSLGMGGTNAHVVLEEAPPAAPASASRPHQLLLLSAKSALALERSTARLADHLRQSPELDLADVAFTLTHGRKAFQHRRALVAGGADLAGEAGRAAAVADAALALGTLDPERLLTTAPAPGDHPVAFLFPGQGAQYAGMGRGLYDCEPTFRANIDRCCRLLEPHLGLDLRQALWPDGTDAANGTAATEGGSGAGAAGAADGTGPGAAGQARLQDTRLAQPALFVVSWATARLWMSWGVRPEAMLGHSIGEYVAACLAGVFTLEDALAVVAARGRLMSGMAPGAMLGVPLPEAEVLPLLGDELSLAAVNRPDVCVVSGPAAAVDELAARLAGQGLTCRRLHTSHAFHSRMMEPVLGPFLAQLARVPLTAPNLPFLSNVTGTWIRAEEATDPAYWVRQLRQAVRFGDAVALLLAEPQRILLEIGPGHTLSTLARQHPAAGPGHATIPTLRHAKQADADLPVLLGALARFWLAGGEVDWTAFWAGERRRRLSLPSYPFERRRYWVDPLPADRPAPPRAARRDDPAEWFYVPVWKQCKPSLPPTPTTTATTLAANAAADAASAESWLVLLDGCGLGEILAQRLEAAGRGVVRVAAGQGFARGPAGFTVAPGRRSDYEALLAALDRTPTHVLHLWNVTAAAGAAAGVEGAAGLEGAAGAAATDMDAALDRAFYSLVFLAQELARRPAGVATAIAVVSNGLCEVAGDEPLDPLKATLLGPVTVAPREMPRLACRSIDVALPAAAALAAPALWERLAGQILAEIADSAASSAKAASAEITASTESTASAAGAHPAPPAIALRGSLRWERTWEPLALPAGGPPRLRQGGVCLITGGMGGIGLELAHHLARESQARLVLVGRTALPPRDSWAGWLAAHRDGGDIAATDGSSDAAAAAGGSAAPDGGTGAAAADGVAATRDKIERLLAIEALGGEVLTLAADVTDPAAMREVLAAAERRFGAVHGVVHAAGVPGGGLLQGKVRQTAERILAPKVRGALVLAELFAGPARAELDLFVLCSSITVQLPQIGQADYVAANAFLDAFAAARAQRGAPAVAIGWDAWRETGMAVATAVPEEWRAWRQQSVAQGLASREGVEAFRRIVSAGLTQVVVSTVELASRQAENDTLSPLAGLAAGGAAGATGVGGAAGAGGDIGIATATATPGAGATHPRPPLATAYVPPQTATERTIAAVWQDVLGVEPVGLHDNFFELGGNSLAGLRLVQRLRERLSASLSEVSLYEAPTVGALANLIAPAAAAAPEDAAAAASATPAEQESRQRGERRKARLLGRRGAAADAAAIEDAALTDDAVLTQPGERTK